MGCPGQQGGDVCGGVDHLLEVVEDEQELFGGEVVGEGVLERASGGLPQ